jgi:hypothetical protein
LPDPEGENGWSTMRSLNLVWSDANTKKEGFGPTNTLMIDSEAQKVRKNRANSIVIQPYSKEELESYQNS